MITPLAVAAALAASSASAQPPEMYVPEGMENFTENFRLAPAIRAGNFVYLSGVTAMLPPGTEPTPEAYETAIRRLFQTIERVLVESGASWSDVVEMTSFHVDMRTHQDVFVRVREEFIAAPPYPAWTAIGVETLWIDPLFLEVRVTAYLGDD